jgi:hypothetical protein
MDRAISVTFSSESVSFFGAAASEPFNVRGQGGILRQRKREETGMNCSHWGGKAAIVLAVIGMAGFGPRATYPTTPLSEPAKLGFSYLSQDQVRDLWRRADNYALAEAFLKHCGAPSFVDRRMMWAAKDCIEARALNRVAAYFRRKTIEFGGKHVFVCDTEQAKALIKSTRIKIDHDVQEVHSMCRSCLFC